MKSSIKYTLYDPYEMEAHGIMHRTTKKDCLDTGNNSPSIPYPYVSLDRKVDNKAELISNRRAFTL